MGKVVCIVGQVALLVGLLGGSFLTVDMARVVNKIWVTSVFWLQVMLVRSLGVSGPCTFHLSFET